MKANEKKIIQHYLHVAHNDWLAAKLLGKQQPRSSQFPTLSQEEVAAYREFNTLRHLADDLGISHPMIFVKEINLWLMS